MLQIQNPGHFPLLRATFRVIIVLHGDLDGTNITKKLCKLKYNPQNKRVLKTTRAAAVVYTGAVYLL